MGNVKVTLFGSIIPSNEPRKDVQVSAANIRELLAHLTNIYGNTFKDRVLDPDGGTQPFVNVFVNNTDIRHLQELDTALKDGDEVLIIPAVAGG